MMKHRLYLDGILIENPELGDSADDKLSSVTIQRISMVPKEPQGTNILNSITQNETVGDLYSPPPIHAHLILKRKLIHVK